MNGFACRSDFTLSFFLSLCLSCFFVCLLYAVALKKRCNCIEYKITDKLRIKGRVPLSHSVSCKREKEVHNVKCQILLCVALDVLMTFALASFLFFQSEQ